MSRSNTTEQTNPAKYFIQWDATEGNFKWYDKEKKENVHIPLPFTFIVLDRLHTVKGYSDIDKSGYWSNEIRDFNDLLIVKNKNGTVIKSTWDEVKREVRDSKYCQSVYIAMYEGKELIIANLQIMGAAVGKWIEFCKANKVMSIAVKCDGFNEAKKGVTKYKEPVFKAVEISEETNEKAIALDKILQEYLTNYLGQAYKAMKENGDIQTDEEVTEESVIEPESDLPF